MKINYGVWVLYLRQKGYLEVLYLLLFASLLLTLFVRIMAVDNVSKYHLLFTFSVFPIRCAICAMHYSYIAIKTNSLNY